MEYNTKRSDLKIPEYGRHVHQMVDYALTIEDRDERNKAAQTIIEVIGNLNPHLRDIPDFKHKLWDHLHIMSDFQLDVDSPYPKPSPDELFEKPKRMEYAQSKIKYRYYGKTLTNMIKEVKSWEESEEKSLLIKALANHMKKSYLNWNKDSVDDDTILAHLEDISGGELELAEEHDLSAARDLVKKPMNQRKKGKRSNKRRK